MQEGPQYPKSVDIPLRIARLYIEKGDYPLATKLVTELATADPYDFRITWTSMLLHLAQNKIKEARECAEAVYAELPGEIAPKLAVAYCAELDNDSQSAVALFNLITVCDVTYPSAAFGLSRAMLAFKQSKSPAEARDAAVEALSRIPSDRSAFPYATMQLARVLVTIEPSEAEFVEAADRLDTLATDGFDLRRVRADVLRPLSRPWLGARSSATKAPRCWRIRSSCSTCSWLPEGRFAARPKS